MGSAFGEMSSTKSLNERDDSPGCDEKPRDILDMSRF